MEHPKLGSKAQKACKNHDKIIPLHELKNFAYQIGIDDLGVIDFPLSADILPYITSDTTCPFAIGEGEEKLHGNYELGLYTRAIVVLVSYKTQGYQGPINLARYTWGNDYHIVVKELLHQLSNYIEERAPGTAFAIQVDTSPLSERYMAYLAGLGFFGKNHCFIHPTLGSYVSIGILLTSYPFPTQEPLMRSCLGCNRCIKACPGQVLGKDTFYYERCKSYLTQKKGELTKEEQTIIGKTPLLFGCDVCQEVCPHNQKVPLSRVAAFQQVMPYVNPEELKEITNRQFKERYGHRAFSWRGKAILLRNQAYIDATNKDY